MNIDKEFKQVIEKHAQILIEKLIARYDELGIRATGDYEKELEARVDSTTMTIFGAFHSQMMEIGRRPGRRPPIPSIMRWIETKPGLPPSMLRDKKRVAFAIATKIAKEGIQVPNRHNPGQVISQVIDDFLLQGVYTLLDDLSVVVRKRIQYDVSQAFKTNIAA